MRRKYLIVNADDYNTDKERNLGIIEAAGNGIVTSTTIISNLPLDDQTLSGLRATFKENIGVHLNLTKGEPLTRGLQTVVTTQGQFLGKKEIWRKALAGRLDLNEIEDEFTAQITHVKELGVLPSHIDGNNHVHVFPGIAGVAARVAQHYGISKVRLPLEAFFLHGQLFQKGVVKKLFIGLLSLKARRIFRRSGFSFTDHFAGIQYPCVSKVASLHEFIQTLPEGTTELMCHPGYSSPSGNPFSNDERRKELASLIHPSVLQEVKDSDITLISYGNLT